MLRRVLLLWVGLVLTAGSCLAAQLTVVEEGPGQLRIDASGLENAAAFDLVLQYDPASWSLQSVIVGELLGGALFAANTETASRVQIGAVNSNGVSGAGTLAYLSGSADGSITIRSFQVKVSDSAGLPLAVSARIPTPVPVTAPSAPLSSGTTVNTAPPTDYRFGVAAESDVLPDTPLAESEAEPVVLPEPLAAAAPANKKAAPDGPPVPESQLHTVRAVLDVLRETAYPDRKIAPLLPLFQRRDLTIRQEPESVLADGISEVVVYLAGQGDEQPDIVARGARLLSVNRAKEGKWKIRLLPTEGSLTASLYILHGGLAIDFPLTVSPAVSLPAEYTLAMEILPQADLDGDGELTVVDDYMLLVNLQARHNSKVAAQR